MIRLNDRAGVLCATIAVLLSVNLAWAAPAKSAATTELAVPTVTQAKAKPAATTELAVPTVTQAKAKPAATQGQPVAHKAAAAEKAEWLFVLTSKNMVIQPNAKGEVQLLLQSKHMEQVLMFSDRPQRLVKRIAVADLVRLWGQGSDSFKQDPPNAVVMINGQSQAVVLTSVTASADQVTFTLKADDAKAIQPMAAGQGALFIDHASWG